MVESDTFVRFKRDVAWDKCTRMAAVSKLFALDEVPLNVEVQGALMKSHANAHGRGYFVKVHLASNGTQTETQRTSAASASKCTWFETFRFKNASLKSGALIFELGTAGAIMGRTLGQARLSLSKFQEWYIPFSSIDRFTNYCWFLKSLYFYSVDR